MDKAADAINKNKNLILSTSTTIASIGLEKAGQKIGGILVTPAVWVVNYKVNGSTPDKVDLGIWGAGFAGPFGLASSIVTGTVKSAVDDYVDVRLQEIRSGEPGPVRPYIFPCDDYGFMAPQINATKVAADGGTAWKHPNGLWVYVTTSDGLLVTDYKPAKATIIYQPVHPLQKNRNGKLRWDVIR